ncbi:MAG: ornithine cyclodeaminase [Polaribacter sp.]|jgi:ornithine cyclodeaminase
MAMVINKEEIQSVINDIDVVAAMEEGFIAYSNGQTVVPPVGELIFDDPKGDTHIKYGYIKQDDFYVIKIASGFYDNPKLGIASSQGLMLVFNQKTGQTVAVLLDDGMLTDIRTAAAGALAAKYFAPEKVQAIGIIGTGIQARMQLEYLQKVTDCKKVWLWGRSETNAQLFKAALKEEFDISIAASPSEVARNCNLIVTTTPATSPLLLAKDIQPGTHITAVGSDTSGKQELESGILEKADLVIADSIPQSKSRGEVYQAVKDGSILVDKITELGAAIQNDLLQRTSEDQITVVDLTGVAVQDIMIAKSVYLKFKKQ